MVGLERARSVAVLGASYAVAALPFSNIAARRLRGVDLRTVGNGTVSGTGLHQVAGLPALAAVGCLELAKGAAGPLLAGRERAVLPALAAGAAVAGHNWSPLLGFAGGRGISVAMGAGLASAPEAALVLLAGLGAGRLAGQTGLGSALAIACLPPVLGLTRGRAGWLLGGCLFGPLVAKRLAGNHRPERPDLRVYLERLLFDRDGRAAPSPVGNGSGEAGFLLADAGRRRP